MYRLQRGKKACDFVHSPISHWAAVHQLSKPTPLAVPGTGVEMRMPVLSSSSKIEAKTERMLVTLGALVPL